jgi:glutamate/tyrosine decarboxylase-like PLP-dependent enzyme
MKADSCVVDLHKLGLYYFEFGLYLTKLDHRESPAIVNLLTEVSQITRTINIINESVAIFTD